MPSVITAFLRRLPADDRQQFAEEFARVAAATTDLDTFAPLGRLVREWRNTAEIHADPSLAEELRQPLPGTKRPVEPPE